MDGSNAEIGIVTTARKRSHLEGEARRTADRLGLPFVYRSDSSFDALFDEYRVPAIYVITDEGRSIQTRKGRVTFNESTAVLRTKYRTEPDPIVRACGLQPDDTVLDATLGKAVDALVIACSLDHGSVTGLECHPMLADLIATGLREGPFTRDALRFAARRISVRNANHDDYLREAPDNSYDVVYFDPMFAETVAASSVMQRLRAFAEGRFVSPDAIREARRVARRCVVLKCRRGRDEGIEYSRHVACGKHIFYGVIDAGA